MQTLVNANQHPGFKLLLGPQVLISQKLKCNKLEGHDAAALAPRRPHACQSEESCERDFAAALGIRASAIRTVSARAVAPAAARGAVVSARPGSAAAALTRRSAGAAGLARRRPRALAG